MNIYLIPLSAILVLSTITQYAFAEDHVIIQKDKAFYLQTPDGALKPAQKLDVQKGDKIIFKNQDKISHNVYSKGGATEFEIVKQAPTTEKAIVFDTAGSMNIRCAIHPRMKLNVSVEE